MPKSFPGAAIGVARFFPNDSRLETNQDLVIYSTSCGCRYEMSCWIFYLQGAYRAKDTRALIDHEDRTAPTAEHNLDPYRSSPEHLNHRAGTSDLSELTTRQLHGIPVVVSGSGQTKNT